MGTKRSPIWVKGGIVFGPRTREYRLGITDSMKRAALNSAILGKIKDKEISVIEGVDFEKPKTKEMAKLMDDDDDSQNNDGDEDVGTEAGGGHEGRELTAGRSEALPGEHLPVDER